MASNSDAGHGIEVDDSGSVYVVGHSQATWNGPTGQNPLHSYGDDFDIVALGLDSSGAYQWHTFYGSGTDDYGYDAMLDGDGLYVAGYSKAGWVGEGGAPPLQAFSGNRDLTALKLDTSGAYQWHTFYGASYLGSGGDYGWGGAVDGNGGVYVAGYGYATWQGDGGAAPLHNHSGGADNSDLVLLKLFDPAAADCHVHLPLVLGEGNWFNP